jgi:glycosyltransferase involved in cell wall biosynthesis
MRVALLRVMAEEHFRSIEVYSEHLIRHLRALSDDIEFVEVTVPAWSWKNLKIAMPYGRSASLHTLGLYLSRWIRYPCSLINIQADIYHVLADVYGHLVFFLPRSRTVVTLHSGTPRSWRVWNPEGPAMWMVDLAFRGLLRSGRVVAVSDHARGELISQTRYPPDRVQVIHHGTEPAFAPLTESLRARMRGNLLQPDEKYLLLHVGHGARWKNVEMLYRALALLRQAGWPVRLLRVGSLPTPAQAQLIDDLGIESAVTHLSHIDNRELPPYYAAADAFCFPSLYEGFGIPLIEAMACGTPVVCSDLALFHEVCADAAQFADSRSPESLAEAMALILGNSVHANVLRARGLERAKEFAWERTAYETLTIYRQMMGEIP